MKEVIIMDTAMIKNLFFEQVRRQTLGSRIPKLRLRYFDTTRGGYHE